MIVSFAQQKLIEQIVNVFETGSPQGNYGEVCIYKDGKGGSRQITYGRSQTTEQGNLRELLTTYWQLGGQYKVEIGHYMADIGKVPLWNDDEFIDLLKAAGNDPVMRRAQDTFFDHAYFLPALAWAEKAGFQHPLSLLAIYDSFIQSGGILDFLRERFDEMTPAGGGDEEDWVKEYIHERGEWLRTYTDSHAPDKAALLRKTVYRTDDIMRAIVAGNWNLDQFPFMANGTPVNQPQEAA